MLGNTDHTAAGTSSCCPKDTWLRLGAREQDEPTGEQVRNERLVDFNFHELTGEWVLA